MIAKEVGNYYWDNALNKETSKVKVVWQRFDGVTSYQDILVLIKELNGHQEISCHVIFDVRMDFQRKARFLAEGHMAEAPNSIPYSSVVSHNVFILVSN